MSSTSISVVQSSVQLEHSPVAPHSLHKGAPRTSQHSASSFGISFPQSTHLTIDAHVSNFLDDVFFKFAFFCHLVVPAFPAEPIVGFILFLAYFSTANFAVIFFFFLVFSHCSHYSSSISVICSKVTLSRLCYSLA